MTNFAFLTCALNLIRKHEVKSPDYEQRLQECIRGVEKKPLPHLLRYLIVWPVKTGLV